MDALMQAFYGVMYKYQKHFSEKGVRANLDAWEQRKKGLLELLTLPLFWISQKAERSTAMLWMRANSF